MKKIFAYGAALLGTMLLAVSPVQAAATETEAPDVSGQKTVYYQPKSVDLTPRKATKEEVKNGEAPAGAYIQSDSVFETASLRHVTDMAKYRLAKYDKLSLLVVGFPNGIGVDSITVGVDGYVQLPYVGSVKLEGKTLDETKDILMDSLGRYIKIPDMSIMISGYGPRRVYVMGEVKSPGVHEVSIDNQNAFAALSSAGGWTRRARSTRIQIIRVIGDTMYYRQLNMKAYAKKHDLTQNVQVQDGDIIYVPRSNGILIDQDILPYFNAWAMYRAMTD